MRARLPGSGIGSNLPSDISIGWKDVACIGPIFALTIYRYAGMSLTPPLIGTHPLLLSGLRGTITSIVTVGAFARVGRASLWLGLLVPLPILMIDAPLWYWAGRRYGRRLLHDLIATTARARRRIARGERLFARYGFWAILACNILPAPNALFYLAAGESEMSLSRFIFAVVTGLLIFIAMILGIGWWAGQRAVSVAEGISRYGWWITGITVGIAVIYGMASARKERA
ncbi:MAG TPA: VTT domain-containing protein [Candidatus Sulfotelmatobacter sp.]|nr:VTT domain-containing protein [Candidatus Sulfotelmatobacter sp.]